PIVINGDSMAVVHLYSNYPDYQWVGDPDEGIAAVDDAARAVVAYLRHFEKFNDAHSLRLAKLLLRFLFFMQAGDGGFYNFIWPDYSINRTGSTSHNNGFNWWAGRAVWAMGYAHKIFSEKPIEPNLRQQLETRLDRAIAKAQAIVTAANSFQIRYGFRVPASGWLLGDGADFSAEMALGLAYYFASSQNGVARALLEKLCDGIAACQLGDAANFPFGLFLSSSGNIHLWHAWGSRQLMALAVAGRILQRQDWINAAKKAADNFYLHLLTSELLAQIDPSLQVYGEGGQIQYGAASTVDGLIELYRTTGETRYAQWAGLFGSWWLGNNAAKFAMYDSTTGRCFDGINKSGVNRNSGGESVVEGLLGLQAAYFVDAARPLLFYHEQNRHAYKIIEAENYSDLISGHPFISNSATYGPARVSNSRYLELQNGDAVRYRVIIDDAAAVNDDYYLYLQFGWQAIEAEAVGVSVVVDGVEQFHAQGGASATFLWVRQLPKQIRLATGQHEIILRYAGKDSQRTAIVDYLMMQPAIQRKIFAGPDSQSLVVERQIPPVTSVAEPPTASILPERFALLPNYPNPFHYQTTLSFDLPQAQEVAIRVLDVLGRKVAVLQRGRLAAGRHRIIWSPQGLPSGIYVIVLKTEATRLLRKVIVMH
ncbi:MAG: T9SS type A sorting domain-containing protein, partial [bacterium]